LREQNRDTNESEPRRAGYVRPVAIAVAIARKLANVSALRADVLNRARRQWNEIRMTAHKRQPLAIGCHGEDIAGKNDAASACPASPMQHRAAFKMTAAAHRRNAVPKNFRLAVP